ncbi:hypothetical protein [Spirosoma gilvum]
MKAAKIRFFSPTENQQSTSKLEKASKPANLKLTGYVSTAGKLVLPAKTVAQLGVDLDKTSFKVGMDEGKRKAKSLYLVPSSMDEGTFAFQKAAKSYTLALPFILKKSGVDFTKTKYDFTVRLFEYEATTAFELKVAPEATAVKLPYTGKPRGRKPKQVSVAE